MAAEHDGSFVEETARRRLLSAAARRARSRCIRPLLQRAREPDALVPAALPLGARLRARLRAGAARGLERAATCRSTRRSPRRRSRSSTASPTRPCSSTTTTSTSRRDWCGRRDPTSLTSHFVHIPWPEPDYWHALPPELRVAVHEGLLANDVVGFHTERWRQAFLLSAERLLGRCASTGRPARSSTAAARRASVAHPISVDAGGVRPASRRSRSARARGGPRRAAAGAARPARRPHRPVEEHRARFPRLRRCSSSAIPSCTAGSGWSRCSRPRGRTSPCTRSTFATSRRRRGR